MLTRWIAGIVGMLFFSLGALAVFQFVSDQVWTSVRHWMANGGSLTVFFGDRGMRVNARLFACIICTLPPLLLLSSLWLFDYAFKKRHDDKS